MQGISCLNAGRAGRRSRERDSQMPFYAYSRIVSAAVNLLPVPWGLSPYVGWTRFGSQLTVYHQWAKFARV